MAMSLTERLDRIVRYTVDHIPPELLADVEKEDLEQDIIVMALEYMGQYPDTRNT